MLSGMLRIPGMEGEFYRIAWSGMKRPVTLMFTGLYLAVNPEGLEPPTS